MVKDSDHIENDILFYQLLVKRYSEVETELNAVVGALEDLHNRLKDIEEDERTNTN